MKRGFLSPGLRVWIIAQILIMIWFLIGFKLEIPVRTLSIAGSIGIVLFTCLGLLIVYFLNKKRG